MRRILLFTGVLLIGLSVDVGAGWAQKKDKGKMPKGGIKADPEDYAKIQNAKELTGSLAYVDGKALTFRMEVQHLEPNPAFKPGGLPKGGGGTDLQRRYNEILRDQAELARAKTPLERQRKLNELRRDMEQFQIALAKAMAKGGKDGGKMPANGPFKVVTEKLDYDLDLEEKIVVRWAKPPFEYDDKGNVKVYTKEELEKLKGTDPKLPGYAAKVDDLMMGQTVKLFLTPPPKDAAKKPRLIDEVEGVGNVPRPTVRMLLIIEESNLPVAPPKKKAR
jgi:hypothetical protein